MRIASLINLELRILKNEFLLSLRNKKYIACYIIVALTGASIYTGLDFFLETQGILSAISIFEVPLTGINPRWGSPLLLIYSLLKGLNPNMGSNFFSPADISILFVRPIKTHEIYISKLVRNGFKHGVFLLLFFLSIVPLFSFYNMRNMGVIALFLFVFIIIEITQLISHVKFFMFYRLYEGEKSRVRVNAVVLISVIVVGGVSIYDLLFTKTGINIFNYCSLLMDSPETIISILTTRTGLTKLLFECFSPLLLLLGVLASASIGMTRNYFGVNHYAELALVNQDRLFGNFVFPFTYDKSKNYQLLHKDALLVVRNYGIQVATSLLFTYGLSYVIIRYRDSISSLFLNRDLLQSALPFLLIIYLKMVLVPSDIIEKDWGSSWLLRSSNISQEIIVKSKVSFGYLTMIPYILPLLASLYVLENNSWTNLILMINLVFLYSPIKTFTSNLFNSGSDQSLDLFLSNFLQILTMFMFWIFFTSLFNTQVSLMFIYSTIIATLFFTKYGKPIKYYVFELISNYYFFTLLFAVILGIFLMLIAFLRTTYLFQNSGNIFRMIWLIIASFSTSFIVKDYIIKWTMRIYLD
jgi:hypothetical protein